MKRPVSVLITLAVALVTAVVAPQSAAAHPYCGLRWGSLPKVVDTGSAAEVVGIRAGRHACFDRLVVDLSGKASGYFVRYVDQVRRDGSGELVPLAGGARLEVVVTAPSTPTDAIFIGRGADVVDVTGYRTFRQATFAGSFEGQTTLGLGVRARLPFRVFILDGPGSGSRVVVDVAHRW